MPPPNRPKIYHICHIDRLPSIIADGCLWCDAEVLRRVPPGTTIGITDIKRRRLEENYLTSHPELRVGDCVPFYFCPRSVMLYLIYQGNYHELTFRGGQDPIIHFESDLHETVAWAEGAAQRWAFTLSNAGACYFEDRADLAHLDEIDWKAIEARRWSGYNISPMVKEGKQAEFLIEHNFPWHLIERIGVYTEEVYAETVRALPTQGHRPAVEIRHEWYY